MISPSEDGEVIFVDNPLECTSFDVVKKIRGTYRLKKVGHAGTLDPLATGLLIICTGKKTKQIESFMNLVKEYTGSMEIGKTTPSVDLETEFDSESDWSKITEEECHSATTSFTGDILQVPPLFSAVKIKGRRAYELAREGKDTKLAPRHVSVLEFQLTKIELPVIEFRIVCSKGTYIRSLVRDFGEKIGTGAYMKSLRRTKIGTHSVDHAITIDQIHR